MNSITSLIGWGLLLSFALLGPVSLPAGGVTLSRVSIRRYEKNTSYFAGDLCLLRVRPSVDSESLRLIPPGTPIRILRAWNDKHGENWLQIQITSFELLNVIGSPNRGWINV